MSFFFCPMRNYSILSSLTVSRLVWIPGTWGVMVTHFPADEKVYACSLTGVLDIDPAILITQPATGNLLLGVC